MLSSTASVWLNKPWWFQLNKSFCMNYICDNIIIRGGLSAKCASTFQISRVWIKPIGTDSLVHKAMWQLHIKPLSSKSKPLWFLRSRNCGNAGWKWILLSHRDITELTIIWTTVKRNSVFRGKRNVYLRKTFPEGLLLLRTTCMPLHKHSPHPPKQFKLTTWEAVRKKTTKLFTSLIILNGTVLEDFNLSADMLFCIFCQHNLDWKCVDTCTGGGLKPMWKQGKIPCC